MRGILPGFSALTAAGVVIEPRKLGLLFAPLRREDYWRQTQTLAKSPRAAVNIGSRVTDRKNLAVGKTLVPEKPP